jgi:hypothetical protein
MVGWVRLSGSSTRYLSRRFMAFTSVFRAQREVFLVSATTCAQSVLALREFALGIEALERFLRREPLRRVHECVFGVLALESEPVDPRL